MTLEEAYLQLPCISTFHEYNYCLMNLLTEGDQLKCRAFLKLHYSSLATEHECHYSALKS